MLQAYIKLFKEGFNRYLSYDRDKTRVLQHTLETAEIL